MDAPRESLDVPLSARCRRYGYIFWPASIDTDVSKLLAGHDSIEVEFFGKRVGRKNIDRKHRRISIGRRQTMGLPENVTIIRLRMEGDGRLNVTAK